MLDERNIAYTPEGVQDYLATVRSIYINFEQGQEKIIDNKTLFERCDCKYPGDENFQFTIKVEGWKSKELGVWAYSRLVIEYPYTDYRGNVKQGSMYIERNYYGSSLFIIYDNSKYYLLFGHDYQGLAAINLTDKEISYYLPASALKGWGFCTIELLEWNSELRELTLNGCYWGGPVVKRIYHIDSFDNFTLENLVYEQDEEEEEQERKEEDE